MTLSNIGETILSESTNDRSLHAALDHFSKLCSRVGGVDPDRSFRTWTGDRLLATGIAINPGAAAHCVSDYRRSIVFIRAVNAALKHLCEQQPGQPVSVLYAGCGPYATLLLPLLHRFRPEHLDLTFLDIHQRSLDSVARLSAMPGLSKHSFHLRAADASTYQHAGELQLVIAETMQKSLEAEPQVAVTENLGRQLMPGGVFIPQCIDVSLCLANRADPYLDCIHVAPVLTLSARRTQHLRPVTAQIPVLPDRSPRTAVLSTRLTAYSGYSLEAGESEITLHRTCDDLAQPQAGDRVVVEYERGQYPRFRVELLPSSSQTGVKALP